MSTATITSAAPTREDIVETLDACPLCSGTSFHRLATPGHWIGKDIFSPGADLFELRRCQSCWLAFVNPRPSQSLLNSFYDCDSYTCHSPKAGSNATANFLLDCVSRYGPYMGGRFLDFGCGGGFLLRAARDKDWNAFGFDVGQRALASCRDQGLSASNNLADFPSSTFDVVFLNHVFEHLAEPGAVLSECRRVLNQRGRLFIVVPNRAGMRARLAFPFLSRNFNVDERHRAFPIHLFYYTPRTLSRTLAKYGFQVAGIETFGLGMDEFINQPDTFAEDAGHNGAEKTANPANAKRKSVLKQLVKSKFFGAGLGENLLAVAQRS